MFPIEKLTTLPMLDRSKISKSVRYWDKAGSEDGGSYTAGVLMHKMTDKTYVIEHVVRGQWSALDREEKIKFWARTDRAAISAWESRFVIGAPSHSVGTSAASARDVA